MFNIGQPVIPPTPEGTSLKGKTCIVTGANTGIGFETARQLLTLNAARVIITARDVSKGEAAVAALRQDPEVKSKNPSAITEVFHLDLDDYQSVLKFCNQVKREVPELDILICNGGTNIMDYRKSKAGHERVVQVNCYGHFLLTLTLLPLLHSTATKRGTPSRVSIVGSPTQTHHTLEKRPLKPTENVIAHFDDRAIYQGLARYSDSKLIINAFVQRLASIIPDSEVVINNFGRGLVKTNLEKDPPLWLKIIMFIFRALYDRTVDAAGRTAIYASVVTGKETHGQFLANNAVAPDVPFLAKSEGLDFTERLWKDFLDDVIPLDEGLKVFKK
ncbi:putative short-chain dehydrogenase [Aspergillus ellipticus CBS 707.79]|uniref:Putative short-chain dehydrogenase n=1 Tax=Aspergillus ellipticus CBS 707.79 TaxID=1448320 RepID=A0A319DS83_9EURO|nr:putative short-chain dehydrogenase [Aspergillus ellipticus CBS 707.79]